MRRPSLLDRYPSIAMWALLILWLATGIAEGMGY